MFRDDTLARTLRDVYLSPLDDLRIGGQVARQTLRAYFDKFIELTIRPVTKWSIR